MVWLVPSQLWGTFQSFFSGFPLAVCSPPLNGLGADKSPPGSQITYLSIPTSFPQPHSVTVVPVKLQISFQTTTSPLPPLLCLRNTLTHSHTRDPPLKGTEAGLQVLETPTLCRLPPTHSYLQENANDRDVWGYLSSRCWRNMGQGTASGSGSQLILPEHSYLQSYVILPKLKDSRFL